MTAGCTVTLLVAMHVVATRSFPAGESIYVPSKQVSWAETQGVCDNMELAKVTSLQTSLIVKEKEEFWVKRGNSVGGPPCTFVVLDGEELSLTTTTDCNKTRRALCTSGPGTSMRVLLYIGVGCHTLVSLIFITICAAKRTISKGHRMRAAEKQGLMTNPQNRTLNKLESRSSNKETMPVEMTLTSKGNDKTCKTLTSDEQLSLVHPPEGSEDHSFPASTSIGQEEQEPTSPAPTPVGPEVQEPTFPAPAPVGPEEAAPTFSAQTPVSPEKKDPTFPAQVPIGPEEAAPTFPAPAPVGPEEAAPTFPAPAPVGPEEAAPTFPAPAPVGPEEAAPTFPAPAPVGPEEQEPGFPAPTPVGPEEQEPTFPAPAPVGPNEQKPTVPAPAPVGPNEQEPTVPAPAPVGQEGQEPTFQDPAPETFGEYLSLEEEPTSPVLAPFGLEEQESFFPPPDIEDSLG